VTERKWSIPEERKPLTRKQRAELFLRQDGKCPTCGQRLETKGGRPVCIDEHVNPLWRLGSNDLANRELWCVPCTRPKTAQEATERGKSTRVRDKHIGAIDRRSTSSGRGFSQKFRKRMDGSVVNKETGEIIRKGRA
jgi:5-methylcytosine-specific restriction endonuclease McrA